MVLARLATHHIARQGLGWSDSGLWSLIPCSSQKHCSFAGGFSTERFAFPPVCELCVRHTPEMRVLGSGAGTRVARRLSTVCSRAWGAAGASGKGPDAEGKTEPG